MPAYDEVVERFQLDVLKEPGDLALVNGDLALTRSGDLMLNNAEYSALYKVVQEWRFNSPTLHYLFDTAFSVQKRKIEIENSINGVFSERIDPRSSEPWPSLGNVARFHELNDELAALELNVVACAGAITMILSRMLLSMRDDMQATNDQWDRSGNLIHGHSVGSVLWASANNFRHNDEWAKTSPPTPQQLRSIKILAEVLQEEVAENGKMHKLSRDVCHEILQLISDGNFDKLGMTVLGFANAFARRCLSTKEALKK